MWLSLDQQKRENDKLKLQLTQLQNELQQSLTKRGRLEGQKREDDSAISRLSQHIKGLEGEQEKLRQKLTSAQGQFESR